MILPGTAVGSILAAAIAGLVVFISTVLTKEQKTSEFRQVWIDEIRKDVSQYIAGVTEVIPLHVLNKGNAASQKKFLEDNFKILHELQMVEHRIVLRLNPTKHAGLIKKITGFRPSMIDAYKVPNRKQIEDELTRDLLATTKSVLTCEWKRVKSGEPTFRRVKYGALFLLFILGLFFLYLVFLPEPPSEKTVELPAQNTTQTFQYFAAPDSTKPTKRIVQQVQNNSTFIEVPIRNDCSHAASKCVSE